MRISRLIPVLLLSFVLPACTSSPVVKLYDGPDQPASGLLRITVPMELEVLTINDRRVEGTGTLFAYGSRELQLLPGEYRVVAYYKDLFELGADQHEVVRSDPAVFTINGAPGDHFMLGFDEPVDIDAARRLASDFEGWVENVETGERIAGKASGLVVTQGFMGALNSDGPASAPAAAVAPASSSPAGSDRLEELKRAWRAASPEERQQFLLWISR